MKECEGCGYEVRIKALFRENEVNAESVADFITKYYKPERYTGRGDEYAACLLHSREQECKKRGFTFISQHDSVTGRIVAYFGDK